MVKQVASSAEFRGAVASSQLVRGAAERRGGRGGARRG
jgi:hypothetical protein